ncbi:unnamed protein product [Rotaria sp. Silwood1]|nr:unnamed protein product [Rotaria sp. Silwood1]
MPKAFFFMINIAVLVFANAFADTNANFDSGYRLVPGTYMVAIIDSGVDYLHPALGGCFGPQCKVAFGYDLVGDQYSPISSPIPVPDDDPMDNCSFSATGTHVAGIIAANATGISQTSFIPYVPFVGVAPQATLGAYILVIISVNLTSLCLVTVPSGHPEAYAENVDAIAAQRVSDRGVYVAFSHGINGGQGVQACGSPGISLGAMSVASVDNGHTIQFYLITPNGEKIFYSPGGIFGPWPFIVNSTIIVNDPHATVNDGCNGPAKSVTGAVVLYMFNTGDSCGSAVRCNKAAAANASGCLLYNVGPIAGSSFIPSGSISLADGQRIAAITTQNPSAVFTFTNLVNLLSTVTAIKPVSD